jgi:AcrR family transcriptional regulator
MALRKPKAERRAEILDAAIALADAEGLAALTMRAVAQQVGVTAMALYSYFPDKDSLLDAMADRAISEVPEPSLTGWRDRLLALAELARDMAREHPSVIQYAFTKPAETPRAMQVVEIIYQALLDADVPHAEIPRLERLVSTFIFGWALSEASGRFAASRMSRQERRELLGPDELPAHDKLAAVRNAPTDWDAEFLKDFTGILDLIGAAATSGPEPRRGAGHATKNRDGVTLERPRAPRLRSTTGSASHLPES